MITIVHGSGRQSLDWLDSATYCKMRIVMTLIELGTAHKRAMTEKVIHFYLCEYACTMRKKISSEK